MLIHIGPVANVPSWAWVGEDIAESIAQVRPVRFFHNVTELPRGAIVVWIKEPPSGAALAVARERRVRLIFFPVDYFKTMEHILEHEAFVALCDLIVLHSPSLAACFSSGKVRHVDHYNKFGTDPAVREPGRQLLWVGGFQYVPYVARYLLESGLGSRHPVTLLTNSDNASADRAAAELGRELGLGPQFGVRELRGLATVEPWSVGRQAELLRTCRAAFDIKDRANFNQFHKPPTKLQKFVCSGVPPAINAGLPLASAFDFDIPEPSDLDHWLSPAYATSVAKRASALRGELSAKNIADRYLSFVAELERG